MQRTDMAPAMLPLRYNVPMLWNSIDEEEDDTHSPFSFLREWVFGHVLEEQAKWETKRSSLRDMSSAVQFHLQQNGVTAVISRFPSLWKAIQRLSAADLELLRRSACTVGGSEGADCWAGVDNMFTRCWRRYAATARCRGENPLP